jgi:hypothetical protein
MRSFHHSFALALLLLLAGCYAELDWREVVSPEGSFKVLLPAKPAHTEREVVLAGVPLHMHMLSAQREGLAFGVGYAKMASPAAAAAVAEAARDALLRNIDGRIVSEQRIEVRGAAAGSREFTAQGMVDGTPMVLAARLIASGDRFYQVVFIGGRDRAENVDVSLYLGSFALLE